jgi:cysteine desulfurase
VVKSSDRHDPTWVPVDEFGRVGVDALLRAIGPQTALVHVQWGNHEVGTLQPVLEVVNACRNRGVLVHVDAAQAVGRVPIDFDALGADLLSVSGHKFGAPPGTGALVVRRGLRIDPLLVGGDQERARRAGFENAPAIAGFGAAAAAVSEVLLDEQRVATTQTERLAGAIEGWDGMHRIGHPTEHLPHIVCIGIDGVEPQAVLLGLDRAGISAHSGSACASEVIEPSPILAAMGLPADRSLRVSVGWTTTDADIDAIIDEIPKIVNDLRRLAR